jgi:hypothetical protein
MKEQRVIKFRALSADQGRVWCYGFYTEEDRKGYIRNEKGFVIRVEPNTVGQFTGLHDKVGNEIYEDDIIVTKGSSGTPIRHKIIFEDGGFCTENLKYGNHGRLEKAWLDEFGFEIEGNVHQHKHLLK